MTPGMTELGKGIPFLALLKFWLYSWKSAWPTNRMNGDAMWAQMTSIRAQRVCVCPTVLKMRVVVSPWMSQSRARPLAMTGGQMGLHGKVVSLKVRPRAAAARAIICPSGPPK